MNPQLDETLMKWVATRADDVVFHPKNGYYSFDIVADAFEKGVAKGESAFKEQMRDKFYERFKLTMDAVKEMLTNLKNKNVPPSKLFISHSVNSSDILMAVSPETHNTDTFIDFAYSEASKMQCKYHDLGLTLDISFVDDNEYLNLSLIKADGFDFAYDLKEGKTLK